MLVQKQTQIKLLLVFQEHIQLDHKQYVVTMYYTIAPQPKLPVPNNLLLLHVALQLVLVSNRLQKSSVILPLN